MGVPKNFSTLVDGESLLNDGTAMVLYTVLFNLSTGESEASFAKILQLFSSLAIGGPVLGLTFGIGVSFLLGKIKNKPILEVCLIFVIGYLVFFKYLFIFSFISCKLFFVCEELGIHFSGVLSIFAYGVFMAIYGKTKVSPSSEEALHVFW